MNSKKTSKKLSKKTSKKTSKNNSKLRPSPTIHAHETPLATIKIGNDKNKWIILEYSKSKRWVKLGQKIRQLDITYNGSFIYKLVITDKVIFIFSYSLDRKINKLIFTINKFEKIYYGKIEDKKIKSSKKESGNTILVEIKPLEYIFIGCNNIKYFNTKEPIIKFVSDKDLLDDIPYPYYKTKNTIGLINNNKEIAIKDESKEYLKKYSPYEFYYKCTLNKKKKDNEIILTNKNIFSEIKNKLINFVKI